jgi:hypothetical protein
VDNLCALASGNTGPICRARRRQQIGRVDAGVVKRLDKGELPMTPVDERAAEVRAIKVG